VVSCCRDEKDLFQGAEISLENTAHGHAVENIIKKMGRKPSYYLKNTPEELEASKRYTEPLNPWAEKAMNATQHGDYEKAEELAKKAIESNPSEARSHLLLGSIYYVQGKKRMALEETLTAERLSKKEDLERFPGTYLSIARLYRSLEEYEKAIEYVNKVLSANKNNLRARSLFAEIYEKMRRYDLAIQEYSLLSKSDDGEIRKIGLEGIRRLKGKK
jgi:tetratricopeptide (TPR) repeat protein